MKKLLDVVHENVLIPNTVNLLIPRIMRYEDIRVELVSKELDHLAAIMHVYAGGMNFMK